MLIFDLLSSSWGSLIEMGVFNYTCFKIKHIGTTNFGQGKWCGYVQQAIPAKSKIRNDGNSTIRFRSYGFSQGGHENSKKNLEHVVIS